MSSAPSVISWIERARLVAAALSSEALAALVFAKVRWLQSGVPARADCRVLDRLHGRILREIERMRRNAYGRERPIVSNRSRPGVNNTVVVLSDSEPGWTEEAQREVEELAAVLGPGAEVHHIGSTAVAGLAAKPIVDLAVALPASDFAPALLRARSALERHGYRYLGVRGGLFFEKGPLPVRTHALQVHLAGNAVLEMLLRFRDLLREDEQVRRDYAATKAAIAMHLPRRRWIYAIYKGHWIQEQQWRRLGAAGWGDWFCGHRRAQTELMTAVRGGK